MVIHLTSMNSHADGVSAAAATGRASKPAAASTDFQTLFARTAAEESRKIGVSMPTAGKTAASSGAQASTGAGTTSGASSSAAASSGSAATSSSSESSTSTSGTSASGSSAPTAESVFGANPWETNPGGTGPNGLTYNYNPYYFATPATAQTVANMLGGTVVATDAILGNVLLPKELTTIPKERVLSLDWPLDLLAQSEAQVILSGNGRDVPLGMFDIRYEETRPRKNLILFRIETHEFGSTFSLKLSKSRGFEVALVSGTPISIRVGRRQAALAAYLSENPPLVRFCDLSELDGNLLVTPKERRDHIFPPERFEPWDWSGTDITAESIWKGNIERHDSIQQRAADRYDAGGFPVIFNDDAKGEAADLVCLKEEGDRILVALIHCKFSGGTNAGSRVKDVVEVCSQAVRSAKWQWRFRELCGHIVLREKRLRTPSRPTRFLKGHAKDLNYFLRVSRFKEVRVQVVIVQPGLSQSRCTNEQTVVLAAAHAFLHETVGIDLDVVCTE